ncbi:hypothetical protein H6G65_11810 [Microcystis elabens FACHB-917]|nr:hypothetical protein [Microcystis elabens FACHB-917]
MSPIDQPLMLLELLGRSSPAYGNGAYSLIGGDELSDAERGESECRA